jgi:hypothetical protein
VRAKGVIKSDISSSENVKKYVAEIDHGMLVQHSCEGEPDIPLRAPRGSRAKKTAPATFEAKGPPDKASRVTARGIATESDIQKEWQGETSELRSGELPSIRAAGQVTDNRAACLSDISPFRQQFFIGADPECAEEIPTIMGNRLTVSAGGATKAIDGLPLTLFDLYRGGKTPDNDRLPMHDSDAW